ncbi:hypothetical protein L0Z16_18730 [Burkholderia multivorans]|uniref:hypothetical protein n=1 Tax=Burkholderia multivorans TaxID=87883 RepID=UPI000D0012EA|nr:hypothetical protein [Burkholderia multivorans]MBU9185811.1 hypothetical protein [Burkholderia multivorans]MCL4661262.1 hypothetical protein [Burkholderia multivorans]MCO1352693.1 hypothetical protein [Burkholderia multivorans]MCO1413461.1 hypothetical protein [Burkholderia multivorans]MCO1446350.1 hypothetical protein [Burkholderia multivorans]
MSTKIYNRRFPGDTSDGLRVRIESRLADKLRGTQERPELLIKGLYQPSRSLIVRRALYLYLDSIARMDAKQIEREGLELHKLA